MSKLQMHIISKPAMVSTPHQQTMAANINENDNDDIHPFESVDDDFVPPPEAPKYSSKNDPGPLYMARVDKGVRDAAAKHEITIPSEHNDEPRGFEG